MKFYKNERLLDRLQGELELKGYKESNSKNPCTPIRNDDLVTVDVIYEKEGHPDLRLRVVGTELIEDGEIIGFKEIYNAFIEKDE